MNAAFKAIERVQRLMSFHDSESEVSKLNRFALQKAVSVSRETYQVLKLARRLSEQTQGIFDITIAPQLINWRFLPRHKFSSKRTRYKGRGKDIVLLPGRRVRFLRPLQMDLGGIAKGFAVDQAVETLLKKKINSGIVNAGGDLRCFGKEAQEVWIRHPFVKKMLVKLPGFKNTALTTSANSYQRMGRANQQVCAHVHGKTRKPCLRPFSVSVRSKSCLIADALTKVVMALGKKAAPVLNKFNATAYIVYPSNKIICSREAVA
jgi:thiamine biosynthesis lipoprotein